ncbi:PREDICTED: uncharacterized protein LOC108558003 [Nicrophorus vespilloides]|uniref:Uncharacterized protein LOC108558003 n=1 Tax=Nicrophorus vespilloides TaxID=110193 RepID=A0ABM1M6S5_NICVS|nr:PREDICTED: uncharacterized protein LOC108558003 [Nicrophorus vespilloides]
MPNKEGIISLRNFEYVLMACPGSNLVIKNQNLQPSQAIARCISGKYAILSASVDIGDIKCRQTPKATVRNERISCINRGRLLFIGFSLTDRFITFIKLCFDDFYLTTKYTEHIVSKAICAHQANIQRSEFTEDNLFNLQEGVREIYKKSMQMTKINKVLGLNYVENSGNKYLSRGHLAAKVDFLYAAQQHGTFKYANALPQWQTLNLNQWYTLEKNIRDYSCNNNLDLIVYTGGFKVMTLVDVRNYGYYIYMYNQKIPVPKYFWKVIRNPATGDGIAFIALNNPYSTDTPEITCRNVCSQITWLTWNRSDPSVTCCYLNEARLIINNIP